MRYHLGSIAFGSLIIAIVQFIRLVMEYINNKTKDLQQKSGFVKCLMCCVRCCLWCFEKCVKYITRNAYIVIAAQGKTFCSATFTVFHILLNNVTTIGIATLVSSLVILLGKLVITAGCTIIAYIWLDTAIKCSESTMSATECADSGIMRPDSPVLPLIFVAAFAYGIAVVFLGVYDMGIETIIVSFCIDKEENSEGQYMYPPTLASVMGAKGQSAHCRR